MFRSERSTVHTSISITDTHVHYLTLVQGEAGLFVLTNEVAELPEKVVVNGEILQARTLGDVLHIVKTTVENVLKEHKYTGHNYTVLLPHTYFLHTQVHVEGISQKKKPQRELASYLNEHLDQYPWVKNHTYISAFDGDVAHIEALSHEHYKSYATLLESHGYQNFEIISDIAHLGTLVNSHARCYVVMFNQNETELIEYRNGTYEDKESFDISLKEMVATVKKQLATDEVFAQKVVDQYGVSRAHPEEKVFSHLRRATTEIIDTLRKKKGITSIPVALYFRTKPVVGMVDLLTNTLRTQVSELDPLNHENYRFAEVLTLHRGDTYQYNPLIVEAMIRLSLR